MISSINLRRPVHASAGCPQPTFPGPPAVRCSALWGGASTRRGARHGSRWPNRIENILCNIINNQCSRYINTFIGPLVDFMKVSSMELIHRFFHGVPRRDLFSAISTSCSSLLKGVAAEGVWPTGSGNPGAQWREFFFGSVFDDEVRVDFCSKQKSDNEKIGKERYMGLQSHLLHTFWGKKIANKDLVADFWRWFTRCRFWQRWDLGTVRLFVLVNGYIWLKASRKKTLNPLQLLSFGSICN